MSEESLNSQDKEELKRRLELLQKEYERTALRLQRAERREADRKHVQNTVSEQNLHINPSAMSSSPEQLSDQKGPAHTTEVNSHLPNTSPYSTPGLSRIHRLRSKRSRLRLQIRERESDTDESQNKTQRRGRGDRGQTESECEGVERRRIEENLEITETLKKNKETSDLPSAAESSSVNQSAVMRPFDCNAPPDDQLEFGNSPSHSSDQSNSTDHSDPSSQTPHSDTVTLNSSECPGSADIVTSCTLIEGLPFPVEYYVRTTRRMASAHGSVDVNAVIQSQLSNWQGRRRSSRGHVTSLQPSPGNPPEKRKRGRGRARLSDPVPALGPSADSHSGELAPRPRVYPMFRRRRGRVGGAPSGSLHLLSSLESLTRALREKDFRTLGSLMTVFDVQDFHLPDGEFGHLKLQRLRSSSSYSMCFRKTPSVHVSQDGQENEDLLPQSASLESGLPFMLTESSWAKTTNRNPNQFGPDDLHIYPAEHTPHTVRSLMLNLSMSLSSHTQTDPNPTLISLGSTPNVLPLPPPSHLTPSLSLLCQDEVGESNKESVEASLSTEDHRQSGDVSEHSYCRTRCADGSRMETETCQTDIVFINSEVEIRGCDLSHETREKLMNLSQKHAHPSHNHTPLSQNNPPLSQNNPPPSQKHPAPFQTHAPLSHTEPPLSHTEPPLSQTHCHLSHTEPRLSHTEPPLSQTHCHLSHTEPPLSHTEPPLSHTEPPLSHTEPPLSHTEPPLSHTEPPLSQTHCHLSHTEPRLSHTKPPLSHTEPPLSLTEPPLSHTEPPLSQTHCHLSHTEPPLSHTKPPLSHTEPPLSLTEPPLSHTEPPLSHTEPPLSHTEPPLSHTEPPLSHTEPPLSLTEPPLSQTHRHLSHTEPPLAHTEPPLSQTHPPLSQTHPPLSHTEPPLSHTEPPLSHTEPPLSHTEPPLSHTEPPLSHTEPPLSHIEPPLSHTEPPLSQTHPPLSHTEPPLSHTEPPLSHTEPPLSHTEPPLSHTEPPLSHTEPPLAHTEPPLSQAHPPLSHTEPPLSHNEPPLSHTKPPLSHTEPPLSHTEPPLSYPEPPLYQTHLPLSHTEPPLSHTEPPLSHTEPPLSHTEPPLSHTEPPLSHTLPPLSHTEPPLCHTEPPLSQTHPPLSHTEPPLSYPEPPLYQTHPPLSHTEPPLSYPEPPLSHTEPPLSQTHPPLSQTHPPLSHTEPPLSHTEPPLSHTEPPLSHTEPPLSHTEPPLSHTEPPLSHTEPPLSQTHRHLSHTEPPLAHTEPPLAHTEPPLAHTEPHLSHTEPPLSHTEPPLSQTHPPLSHTEPPLSHTEPPLSHTEPPLSQTHPPLSHTEPPLCQTLPAPVLNSEISALPAASAKRRGAKEAPSLLNVIKTHPGESLSGRVEHVACAALQKTHTLKALDGGCVLDVCLVRWSAIDWCVCVAGEWSVCVWKQNAGVHQWSLLYTWTFTQSVISLQGIPDSSALLCVCLGRLEITESRILHCPSTPSGFCQAVLCKGALQAVLAISDHRVACCSTPGPRQSVQVFTLTQDGRVAETQSLVCGYQSVQTLVIVEREKDALIGWTEHMTLLIWNMTSGQLLQAINLGHNVSMATCLRGYSYRGVLCVLLQQVSACHKETDSTLFTLMATNPVTGKYLPLSTITAPSAPAQRLIDGDVCESALVGVFQSGLVIWNLAGGVACVYTNEPAGACRLARWAGPHMLLTGDLSGDVNIYQFKPEQSS